VPTSAKSQTGAGLGKASASNYLNEIETQINESTLPCKMIDAQAKQDSNGQTNRNPWI
jgi:hypothetical protein